MHQVIHIVLGPGHHRGGLLDYKRRQPESLSGESSVKRLAKPEKGHLDLTRETLEAIKTVKPLTRGLRGGNIVVPSLPGILTSRADARQSPSVAKQRFRPYVPELVRQTRENARAGSVEFCFQRGSPALFGARRTSA